MKLFRFSCIFMILALTGGLAHAEIPWGILTETVDDTTFSIYAIDNLIDNRPIRYAVSARVTPQEEQIFKENILKWPAETLRIVRESGRPEFNDITPILERKLVLERVSVSDTPDIYLEITENVDCNGISADGCFKKKGDLPYSVISLGPSVTPFFRDVSLHEIGHYFGLGDQYDRTRVNSHPEYSSDVNKEEGAVMRDPYITNGKITCDDADGFINLLDLRLAQRPNGRFPDRAQKGWRGLCPSIQNNYEKSKTTNRQAVDSWEGIDFTLRTYKKGELLEEWTAPIASEPLTIFDIWPHYNEVQRNPDTHLISTIHKTARLIVTSPDGKVSSRDAPYAVSFHYGKPILLDGNKTVPLSVKETIDGQVVRTHNLTIAQNGDVEGLKATVTKDFYFANMGDYCISLHHDASLGGETNRPAHFSSCNIHTKEIKWASNFDNNTASFYSQGKVQSVSLPCNGDWTICRYQFYCDETKRMLESFYQNFYNPLFDTSAQEMQTQVKQAMSTRR